MTKPDSTPVSGLPAPRLQLRWRKPKKREANRALGRCDWVCVYELVLPLEDGDIRKTKAHPELVKELSRTFTTRSSIPTCEEPPFRDGVHAQWDSKALGGIPIYIIGADGQSKLKLPYNQEAA